MSNCLKLPLSFDPELLKADLDQILPSDWVSHFNARYYEGDWSGVALRAVGGVATQLYSDPAAREPFADTPLLARCPNIQQALAQFNCAFSSARLLRLGPGSRIREHKDYHLGFEEGEIGIHIPIITNPLVNFFLNGERLAMNEGECWYLNLFLPHRVENLGERDRIHLVIHCIVNDWLRSMINFDSAGQIEHSGSGPQANIAKLTPQESLNRFRQIVLDDLTLQEQIREKTNIEYLAPFLAQLGKERGYNFTAEDVKEALRASRRAWIERWVQG